MNDRSVSVLDNYDLEVQSVSKGRNAYICQTDKGIFTLEEYKGSQEKLACLENLLMQIEQSGCCRTDRLIRNKEGELCCKDAEGFVYILKKYRTGRECSVKNKEELLSAIKLLGRLHNVMEYCQIDEIMDWKIHTLKEEVEKHNRELRHVRKYLRRRSDKTEFERELLYRYQFFLDKAIGLEEKLKQEEGKIVPYQHLQLCHGDYQYHNILIEEDNFSVIHFENFHRESCIKDLYLFLRKVMEKHNWSMDLWNQMIQSYQQERTLSLYDWMELYNRFSYPEKFWKIVNFYLNNRKSWQPEKNLEKIRKVFEQDTEKEKILQKIRKHVD